MGSPFSSGLSTPALEASRRRPAVFLDRDGVINANLRYPDAECWEAPRRAEDFRLLPGALAAMQGLSGAGLPLLLVSNQPNQAKGKATRADHDAIHARLVAALATAGVTLLESYYCFHHPEGVVPGLSGPCACRKPSPHFLLLAAETHGLDLATSWLVGDRATDMACAHRAGVRAVGVAGEAGPPAGAEFAVADLAAAAALILAAR